MSRPNKSRAETHDSSDEANLAKRIATERRQMGLSYEALAKLMTDAGCAIQGSAIYKIEKADPPRRITVNELVAFAKVFDKSVDDLLTPIELIFRERALKYVDLLDAAESRFTDSVAEMVNVYSEFLMLADIDPELRDFVHYRRASTPDRPTMRLRAVPGHDNKPFARDTGVYMMRIVNEAADRTKFQIDQIATPTKETS